jgi:hypothetical protein
MEVDYIRVYRALCLDFHSNRLSDDPLVEDPNSRNIGCDPPTMPTSKYISLYPDAYNNPNIVSPRRLAEASRYIGGSLDLVWSGLEWFASGSVRFGSAQSAALTLHQTVMGEIANFTKPKNRLIDTC